MEIKTQVSNLIDARNSLDESSSNELVKQLSSIKAKPAELIEALAKELVERDTDLWRQRKKVFQTK